MNEAEFSPFLDLDYSKNRDLCLNIDERILKFCENAEKSYEYQQKKSNELKSLKYLESKIKIDKQNQLINSNNDIRNEFLNELESKKIKKNYSDNRFQDRIISLSKTPDYSKINQKEDKDLLRNRNEQIVGGQMKDSLNEFNHQENPLKKSLGTFSYQRKTNFKSHCKACELKKKINLEEIKHEDHIKFQFNVDTNNTIIQAKKLMKKLNYSKAYEILQLPILQGVKHSDIFYLFGEVNRILKNFEKSEKFLLESLKFERHSPFVYYSLGLLYQELCNYKESVSLFKHFLNLVVTPDAHFQIAKSYFSLNKNLKSVTHITKAIELNPNCYDYFMFRSSVYEIMEFKELAHDDLIYAKNLRR